jgi:hypothetical protein
MEPCPICFEDMDMKYYNDEKEYTETCFKLECNHAFHTKCLIKTLQISNSSCPSCNLFKTHEQLIRRDGIIKSLISELKRNPEVYPVIQEFREAKKESDDTLKLIETETKEFIKKKIEEYRFEEKRKYSIESMTLVKRRINAVARAKGPMYIGALQSFDKWTYRRLFETKILGLNGSWRCLRSITFPTVRIPLYNMK